MMDLTSSMLVVIWDSHTYILVVCQIQLTLVCKQAIKVKEESWISSKEYYCDTKETVESKYLAILQ